MKELKQLIVFLCKEKEWNSYKACNLKFMPVSSKNVRWLAYDDVANNRRFVVMKWGDADRKPTRDLFLKGGQPRDMTKMSWCRHLREMQSENNETKVRVFIHWGETEELQKVKKASENLQAFLRPKSGFGTWEIFSLSSLNMDVTVGPIGRVFDVGEPVVPVSNFDDWFKMYTKWWEGGRSAVETAYSPPVAFPNHKDGRINLSDTGAQVVPEEVGNGNTSSGGNGPAKTPPQGIPPKCKNVWSQVVAVPLVIMMGALSLVPVWMTCRCLSAISFQAKTVRGTISILLVALLSTAFTEFIFGWLLLTILPRRHGGTND